jgi:hypothetical protein
MGHYNGGKKETSLASSTTFDFVRVIKDSASRRISITNFVAAIESYLIALGFLTTDDLPVSVSQTRLYAEKTNNYGLQLTDSVIGVDTTSGDVSVNLMTATSAWVAASNKAQYFTIKNITSDTNKVIINANGSDLIDGFASIELDSTSQPFITLMAISTTKWILI